NVSSANGGTNTGAGGTGSAPITVVAPPTLTKSFSKNVAPIMGVVTISFTITNPNATAALTGGGFTDTFPSGMMVATPPNATDTCGGVFAPAPGDTSLIFTGGMVAAGGSCTLSVDVKLTTPGIKNNTTGPVTSANGGTGQPSNTATVATFDICIKDDNTGDLLQWSTTTCDYLFTHCGPNGFTLTGKGTCSVASGIQQIKDNKPDRSISGGFNPSTLTGSANVYTINSGIYTLYRINDTNPHIPCQCGPNTSAQPVKGEPDGAARTQGTSDSGGTDSASATEGEPRRESWLAIGWEAIKQALKLSATIG